MTIQSASNAAKTPVLYRHRMEFLHGLEFPLFRDAKILVFQEFRKVLPPIHFVGRSLRDLHVESSIFCTAVSCSGAQFLAGVN